ncbi:MAG: hypothetical protein EOO46_16735 [Flavobacterium sp.]|nr:MAG: hypothetical protein EOO46_16735 [Flavobacterium sp.]
MFYTLRKEFKKSAIMIESKIEYDYGKVFENPEILVLNNSFTIHKGKKAFDVILYCDPLNFAISERFKNILEENEVTGWECYPIIIEGLESNYFGFHTTGKGGEVLNLDKDGLVPTFEPIQWDQSKWDGSDIFNIEDTGIKACTQRIKEILEKAKITNLEIKPL